MGVDVIVRGLCRLSLALGCTVAVANAQGAGARHASFSYQRFEANERIALWMTQYDRCSWITADSVATHMSDSERQRLGPERFCWQDLEGWHASFGTYDELSDRYETTVHYRERAPGFFTQTGKPVDYAITLPFARALRATRSRLPAAALQSGIRFNSFVRREPITGGVEVWYLPAWQTYGSMVFGIELRWLFDREGRTVVDSSFVIDPIQGSPPSESKEIVIDNRTRDVPTVGQTFFILAYRTRFRDIRVHSQHHLSWLHVDHNGSAWMHTDRVTLAGSKR